MSKKDEAKHRARYTLEFKLEAVRLVKAGQEASVTARVLGIPKQTLSNWVRLAEKGELQGAGDRPVSAEQMELARLTSYARDVNGTATSAKGASTSQGWFGEEEEREVSCCHPSERLWSSLVIGRW